MSEEIDENLLADLYDWVDKIPLSRPKKDIRRDFADGVMVAEMMKHHLGPLVDVNNYVPSTNTDKKRCNWAIMNRKVFRKLNFEVKDDVIDAIVLCKPFAVENFLLLLRLKIDRYLYEKKRRGEQKDSNKGRAYRSQPDLNDRTEADQMYKWTEASSALSEESRASKMSHERNGSVPDVSGVSRRRGGQAVQPASGVSSPYQGGHMVPRVAVEEMEQEILGRDETVQIMKAKIRRLEQLLHLKDIRLDDLQSRMERLDVDRKPTSQVHQAKNKAH